MSTITKERVAQFIKNPLDNALTRSEQMELARIALASLEAEPLCYLTWHQGFRAPDDCEEYVVEAKPGDKSCDGSPAFPVYAAPPALVSVPDEVNVLLNHLEDVLPDEAFSLIDVKTWNNVSMLSRPDVYRAAMLQGAK